MPPKRRATRSSAVAADDSYDDQSEQLFRGGADVDSPAGAEGGPSSAEVTQAEGDQGMSTDAATQPDTAKSDDVGAGLDDVSMTEAAAPSDPSEPKIASQEVEGVPMELTEDGARDDQAAESETVAKSDTKSTLDGRETTVEEPTGDLLASLPVYLSNALPSSSLLQIFQYPTYARGHGLPIPQSSSERGLRPALRVRPRANRVEVELPLDLRPLVYNTERGEQYGRGAAVGGSIGPGAAGEPRRVKSEFGEAHSSRPSHGKRLEKTRLESSLMPHQTNYMIGIIRDKALHLTSVHSMHQLRPSMHYLDALQALERQSKQTRDDGESGDEDEDGDEGAASVRAKKDTGAPQKQRKTQSVNVSINNEAGMQGGGGGGGGRGGGGAAAKGGMDGRDHLMQAERDAESERWIDLEWKDERSSEARKTFDGQLFATTKTPLECTTKPREFLVSKNQRQPVKGVVLM